MWDGKPINLLTWWQFPSAGRGDPKSWAALPTIWSSGRLVHTSPDG